MSIANENHRNSPNGHSCFSWINYATVLSSNRWCYKGTKMKSRYQEINPLFIVYALSSSSLK